MPQAEAVDKGLLYSILTGIVLILLMPFIVTTSTIFPFIVGKAIYSRTIIEILFGIWIILAYRNPSYRPPRSLLLTLFAVYLGVSLMAGVFGVSLLRSLWSTFERMQGIIDLAHWFAFTLVLTSVLRTLDSWRLLLNVSLGISLILALFGIIQQYDLGEVPGYAFMQSSTLVSITLGNPSYVGAYMLVNTIIGIGMLGHSFLLPRKQAVRQPARRRSRRAREMRTVESPLPLYLWRAFWVTVVILDLWVMILSGTRGALAGLLAGLLAFAIGYALLGQLRTLKLVSFSLIILVSVVTIFLVFARSTDAFERAAASNLMIQKIQSVSLTDASIRGRVASVNAGVAGFANRPILGWGPENYTVVYGRYYSGDLDVVQTTFDQAHNKPLEELATKGLLGFISYMAMWGFMLVVIIKAAKRQGPAEQFFTLFIGTALISYFVQNLFLFDTPATFMPFILLLSYVVNLETLTSQGADQSSRSRPGAIEHLPRVAFVDFWSRLDLRASLSRLKAPNIFGVGLAPSMGLLVIVTLVSLSIYFINYRAYNAATTILKVSRETNTFEESISYFEDSINSFGPLANYPRLILFTGVTDNWDKISDEQSRSIQPFVEKQAEQAIESEPENWRIYVALATMYQKAAAENPKYLPLANEYFEKASYLAPERAEVRVLSRRQVELTQTEYNPAP